MWPSVLESVADISEEQIDILCKRALDSPPQIKNQSLCTLFLEPSTRTRLSFALASQGTGLTCLNLDPGMSALEKGENLEETLKTLGSLGVGLCALRSPIPHVLAPFKEASPLKLINAGDGTNEHPTQALGDILTMRATGFDPRGKRILILGDSAHSRVSHSLCRFLPRFGAKIILASYHWLVDSSGEYLDTIRCHNLKEALGECDLVYLLRPQRERHQARGVSDEEYHHHWGLTPEILESSGKEDIPIYHAGPVNVGVEISRSLLDSPLYRGYDQVKYGVLLRRALILSMLGCTYP